MNSKEKTSLRWRISNKIMKCIMLELPVENHLK